MRKTYLLKKRSGKGWVLIYTIVICSIMTLIVTNLLGGLERKNVYLDYYMNTILKEDLKQKKKEYLMTEFNAYMKEHMEEIKEKGFEEYFKQVDISRYLSTIERDGIKFKEGCNIKFNSKVKAFEVNVGTFIYRFYPIIDEENVKYKFIVIANEEGI